MADMQFTKASKASSKLRLAMFGPSGSGKTFTSLAMATGMGGKIAVIDTERGSASKYADRFSFDVLDLPSKTIDTYCAAIKAAGKAGYDVLIIDSLTHAWQDLLQEVDRLANSKYRGNTWSAWSEGTPKQRDLVEAILDFPGHMIATMRTKTEWTSEKDEKGRVKPVRVGLAPEQGKGIEYEFDLLMEISPSHVALVIKDRTGKYQDATIDKPGDDLGRDLMAWLSSDKAQAALSKPAEKPASPTAPATRAPAPQVPMGSGTEKPANGNGTQPAATKQPVEWSPDPLTASVAFNRNSWLDFIQRLGATDSQVTAALGTALVSDFLKGDPKGGNARTPDYAATLVARKVWSELFASAKQDGVQLNALSGPGVLATLLPAIEAGRRQIAAKQMLEPVAEGGHDEFPF